MVTINNSNPPTQVSGSNNTGLIILSLVILAGIVLAAVFFFNGGELSTSSTSNTVDRTVHSVEKAPAKAAAAVDNATPAQ